MAGKTAVLPNMLCREVYRNGPIVSITNWAIRHEIDPVTAWLIFCKLEQQGKVVIQRNGKQPAIVDRNPMYQPVQPSGMCYQLALWS